MELQKDIAKFMDSEKRQTAIETSNAALVTFIYLFIIIIIIILLLLFIYNNN